MDGIAADTGTCKFNNGGMHYEGQMNDGIPHGTGVLMAERTAVSLLLASPTVLDNRRYQTARR